MGYNLLINGVYWGYHPLTNHLLTSWDIQVYLYQNWYSKNPIRLVFTSQSTPSTCILKIEKTKMTQQMLFEEPSLSCHVGEVVGYNTYIYIYLYATPPEKSTVFIGVVRANSRKIFEVEDKFSQNNDFC